MGGVPVIFSVIQSINRSKPHVAVIHVVMQLVYNLVSYLPTSDAIYSTPRCLETFVLLIPKFVEEHEVLFAVLQVFYSMFAVDPARCSDVPVGEKSKEPPKKVGRLSEFGVVVAPPVVSWSAIHTRLENANLSLQQKKVIVSKSAKPEQRLKLINGSIELIQKIYKLFGVKSLTQEDRAKRRLTTF